MSHTLKVILTLSLCITLTGCVGSLLTASGEDIPVLASIDSSPSLSSQTLTTAPTGVAASRTVRFNDSAPQDYVRRCQVQRATTGAIAQDWVTVSNNSLTLPSGIASGFYHVNCIFAEEVGSQFQQRSELSQTNIYVDSTLSIATRCAEVDLEPFYTAAQQYLATSAVFGSETRFGAADNKIQFSDGSSAELPSYRKAYTPKGNLILISRSFYSRTVPGLGCNLLARVNSVTNVMTKWGQPDQVHYTCKVIAINADKMAACLDTGAGGVTLTKLFTLDADTLEQTVYPKSETVAPHSLRLVP